MRTIHRAFKLIGIVSMWWTFLVGWSGMAQSGLFQPSTSETATRTVPGSAVNRLDGRAFSIDGPVDPQEYKVGPGDIFSIGIWGSLPTSFPIQISMEGTAIIPTIGEVVVAGLSLAEAKELMVGKARSKYVSGEITATLIAPRSFIINVSGQVRHPGAYTVSGGQRVSSAIKMALADVLTEKGIVERKEFSEEKMSLRHIRLIRQERVIPVDLIRYRSTGESRWNPLLADGDRIMVPVRDDYSFVSIYGAVTMDGIYEYVMGDSLSHILAFAGGALESANLENVQISRLAADGNLKETIAVDYSKIQSGSARDIRLEPNDRILIPTKPIMKRDYKIYVDGEVQYKGFYPIARNGTRLSEILKKIGLKEYSSLNDGFVIRNVRYENVEYLFPYLLRKNFSLTLQDTAYFSEEARLLSSSKFISVNLAEVAEGKMDLDMYDNDYLFIPAKIDATVYVFGQINNPGFIPYVAGKDYAYYVNHAGGLAQFARKGDIKIIKHKTYSWLDAEDAVIEPGDFIFVTKKIIREPAFYWNLTKDIILTIGAVASTAATIILITRY